MLDRQRLVWSRQAEKLNVAYVSSDASHFSPKQTAKTERQVWSKSWTGSAAVAVIGVLAVNDSKGWKPSVSAAKSNVKSRQVMQSNV